MDATCQSRKPWRHAHLEDEDALPYAAAALRGCLERGSGSPGRQASKHEAAHGSIHHGRARLGQVLVLLAQPPMKPDPCKRPLDNPAPLQELEAGRFLRWFLAREDPDLVSPRPPVLDHLDAPPQGLLDPGDEAAPVADVDPPVAQPRKALAQVGGRLEQPSTDVPVGDVRRRPQRPEPEALGVAEQMPLAALHFFAAAAADGGWLSRRPPPFRRLHPLALDKRGAGGGSAGN